MEKTGKQSSRDFELVNSKLVIILFAFILLVPSVAQLLGVGSQTHENRVLAPFPHLNRLKEIKDLPILADAYVNDRFGLRSQLVHINSRLRYSLGLSSSNKVVIGKDGWLFYNYDRILEQHTGADVFTPDELDDWIRQMEAIHDWLQKRNIALFILAAPEKSSIYPEKLPQYPRSPATMTRLDQLVARTRGSKIEVIDPRKALIEAKRQGVRVYFEGDSHWTQRGAFIAYSLLMSRVREKFPTIRPLSLDDYRITQTRAPIADLARLLTLESDLSYSIDHLELSRSRQQIGSSKTTYRPNWTGRVVEVETALKGAPRLYVIGDSFTDYVLGPDMLYETFRDPVWTSPSRLGNSKLLFNFDLIAEIKPSIVLYQFAERYLYLPMQTPQGMP